MIIFKTLTLRNFLSYGNNVTTIQLDNAGTTLIVGEDLDNTTNGQGANGTGKSTLINALTYAVYDKPVSNISKDNLVNNINKKNMEVSITFTASNGKEYTIKRTRKMKSGVGNSVYLYEEGKDITLDSAANTNELIEQIVGIPYELFVRIVVFSASHVPFLDLPVKSQNQANQTSIIEELFGLTALSLKANSLKELIRETENRLELKQVTIEHLEKEHARLDQQIDSAKRRVVQWEQQNEENIEKLKSKLLQVESINIEEQHALHLTVEELEDQINAVLTEQRGHEKRSKEVQKVADKAATDLTHLQDEKCPYCLQQYANAGGKIDDTIRTIDQSAAELTSIKKKIGELDQQIETLTKQLKDTRQHITVDNIEELIHFKNESSTIRTKIEDMTAAINPHLESLDELTSIKIEKVDYSEVNKLTKEIEHQKFLLKLLTKKDSFVRKALINKNIPYLNGRLQYYLAILGLPHKVEFTHEMTAAISQLGRPLDFGNLSAGQRARVNLALSFAFRDVLQGIHTRVNICMLDEVLDVGLDAVGVQSAVKLLKRKSREESLSMYIISHRDEIGSSFDNTMTVQMSKGFSYVKVNSENT